MKYTYDYISHTGARLGTDSTCPDKFSINWADILVLNNITKVTHMLHNQDDLDSWSEAVQREFAWGDPSKIKEEWGNSKEIFPINNVGTHPKYTLGELTGKTSTSSVAPTVDHTNPPHYKDIIPEYQYMEMMQYMLKDVESALWAQIYKYQMRCGKKDPEIRELWKIRWYLDFLLAYTLNDKKPIRIKDIPKLLGELA